MNPKTNPYLATSNSNIMGYNFKKMQGSGSVGANVKQGNPICFRAKNTKNRERML